MIDSSRLCHVAFDIVVTSAPVSILNVTFSHPQEAQNSTPSYGNIVINILSKNAGFIELCSSRTADNFIFTDCTELAFYLAMVA